MDINDHIIRTHLIEAEFSAVCDISRDNYSQAVRADERKTLKPTGKKKKKNHMRVIFNISIVYRFAVWTLVISYVHLECQKRS